ncbi:MAG: polysaccharide deacetylase family protein [Planctomycetes bacterium]|nr:polysaccharide deacetylase family protein [Planctomycetota bacterium]
MNSDVLIPIESCLGTIIRVARLDSLLRTIRPIKVPILMYHSVTLNNGTSETCLSLAGMCVSVAQFQKHMEYLLKRYNTISLFDFIEWLSGKKKLPKNPCIITFDDGFLDVYENAVPILRRLGLTATFFVIGRTLETGNSMWLYELYTILDSLPIAHCISVFSAEIENFPLTERASKAQIRSWIRHYFSSIDKDKRNQLLGRFRHRFNGDSLKPLEFMDPQQVRELMVDGFQVGSHSMNHEYLSKLGDSQLEEDIGESKRTISEIIGDTPKTFCYPFGGIDSWDKRVVEILKKKGFLCAVSTVEGLNNWNTDLFALQRIRVTGNIPLPVFVFRILGLRSWLWWLHTNFRKLKGSINSASS